MRSVIAASVIVNLLAPAALAGDVVHLSHEKLDRVTAGSALDLAQEPFLPAVPDDQTPPANSAPPQNILRVNGLSCNLDAGGCSGSSDSASTGDIPVAPDFSSASGAVPNNPNIPGF